LHYVLIVALAVAAVLALAVVIYRLEPEQTGQARALDGDSLRLGAIEIRLYGIDAPEYRQTCIRDGRPWACGIEAANALRALVAGREVTCRPRAQDRFRRTVAVCYVGNVDLGRAMVRDGLAVAYGAYEAEEQEARAARRGLWSSSFERPAEWRARHPHHSGK
jgi:endonuclease YncB( thermonuclease family)